MITLEEFKKAELRIAEIEDAAPHPNADRLYVLKIKVGEERKQIVAGIRLHYGIDELKGKDLLFIAGGLGIAPLRSLINYVFDKRKHLSTGRRI